MSEAQSSNSILLVRPASFGFHAEAAESNAFARAPADSEIGPRVLGEFDGLAQRLTDRGVDVRVLADTPDPRKPDAVFPNNWCRSTPMGRWSSTRWRPRRAGSNAMWTA